MLSFLCIVISWCCCIPNHFDDDAIPVHVKEQSQELVELQTVVSQQSGLGIDRAFQDDQQDEVIVRHRVAYCDKLAYIRAWHDEIEEVYAPNTVEK